MQRFQTLIIISFVLFQFVLLSHVRADNHWQALDIVDIQAFPWDQQPRFVAKSKTFFRGPNGSSFIYVRFPPRWDMQPPADPLGQHYHHWHEWAYVLQGDFVIHEPVRPLQGSPVLSHFRQGTWLDRPAYSLHGGVWEVGGLRGQNACTLIIFEEGDGSVVTLGPDGDHFKPDFPDKPVPYDADWQSVKQFPHPWIVHSASDMEWETVTGGNGMLVKWLSDDHKQGFRGRLVKLPPDWRAEPDRNARYFKSANRFIYVIYGEMALQLYSSPGQATQRRIVSADHAIHQPPGSIFGYTDGAVTGTGVMFLEVTYAKGVAVGGGRIEQPIWLGGR
ncbi:MAG: hypothetical protein ACR2P9_07315 [Gammaproteobacteria bacterium]